jgi:ppGpp synthetase/RelA/SpoT-type nucleotidyltranferase
MVSESSRPTIPLKNQKDFIRQYQKIRPLHVEFTDLLENILRTYAKSFSLLAIVQSRAKSVISFSNKIILKDKYLDPLVEVTDLSGARVIVHLQYQVEKVCDFIRGNFTVDEANSLDLKSRLKVNEFGYRSIHFIVTPKKDTIAGIRIDKKFRSLKGEVQVRTIAEHMWTDISHDRIYKTKLVIPDEWKREAARLSAVLENADNAFSAMSSQIDSVTSSCELQHYPETAQKECEKIRTLVAVLGHNTEALICLCLQLSAIYRASDRFSEIIAVLEPYIERSIDNPVLEGKLWFYYGFALARVNNEHPGTPAYRKGMNFMQRAMVVFDSQAGETIKEITEEISYLYYIYGKLLQISPGLFPKSYQFLAKAYGLMQENPYYQLSLIETLALQNPGEANNTVFLFRPTLISAIPRIKQLIWIGIQRVPAWFAIGRCYLFIDDEIECISSYANAVNVILDKTFLTGRTVVYDEIKLIEKLTSVNVNTTRQIIRFLRLALYLISEGNGRKQLTPSLETHKLRKEPIRTPVTIVSGEASSFNESMAYQYKEYIEELQRDYSGTIITGGTTAEIPRIFTRNNKKNRKKNSYQLLAYRSGLNPKKVAGSSSFQHHNLTVSVDYSALEILSYWTDLILQGILPSETKVFGFGGGDVSGLEYKIALSLGAKVYLLSTRTKSTEEIVKNPFWGDHPGLVLLPQDPHTIWACMNVTAESILLKPKEVELLARVMHEHYRKEKLKRFEQSDSDINNYKVLMEWDYLDEDLKKSNFHQVAFYQRLLQRMNFGLRKADKPVLISFKDCLSPESYKMLAKLEHGRWNAERLMRGWQFGAVKDIARKISPYLIPWDSLPLGIKELDYHPIELLPLFLSKIGYELYSTDKSHLK